MDKPPKKERIATHLGRTRTMEHDALSRFALDETVAANAGYGFSTRRQGEAERNLLVAVL